MLERSLETYASLPDPSPYQMAHLKNAIADLETYLGNLERSERLFREAIETWEAHPGNANVAIPLVNLGALLNRKGEHEQALELCSRAREVDEASLGPEHPDLGFAMTCIGEALIGLDRPADARPLLERAVRLRAEVNAWELAWSKFQLGRALYRLGAPAAGAPQIAEARRLLLEHPGPDSRVNELVAGWTPAAEAGAPR